MTDEAEKIVCGDCLDVMRDLPDACVDAIVTDPPYGLEFMGKEWDAPWKHGFSSPGYADAERLARPSFTSSRNPICLSCGKRQRTWEGGPAKCSCPAPKWDRKQADESRAFQAWCEEWAREALRVAKPGAHLVAFGGTRTYHRLACAIEDAGWEIRDCFSWLYGSGFPKSLSVSAAIAKRAGGELQARAAIQWMQQERERLRLSRAELEIQIFGRSDGNVRNWEDGISLPKPGLWPQIRAALGHEATPFDAAMERGDKKTGEADGSYGYQADGNRWEKTRELREPATDAAKQWQGWGTALKPAWEPIILARKPLVGTVASNVLAHGTGALNIDGCRIGTTDNLNGGAYKSEDEDSYQCIDPNCPDAATMPYHDHPAPKRKGRHDGTENWRYKHGGAGDFQQPQGRWPANVSLDEEAAAMLDEQSGTLTSGKASTAGHRRKASMGAATGAALEGNADGSLRSNEDAGVLYGDSGGASRFFYTAKASRAERTMRGAVDNKHPTVKPVSLMRWLVRMVTPPQGSVLDPFAGSGTTLLAAHLEGFDYLGIEREAEYVEIIRERLRHAETLRDSTDPSRRRGKSDEGSDEGEETT